MWRFSHSTPPRRTRGAFIIFFAIILSALLALIGLAVDLGFGYRTRILLQHSLDIAALRGTAHVIENQLTDPEVLDRARRVALANLSLGGFSPEMILEADSRMSAEIILPRQGVRISSATSQPLFIIPSVSTISDLLLVGASAAATSRPISLIMLIDRSGSMGNCMNSPPGPNPCPITSTDMDRLTAAKIAANQVVDAMQPGDQIGLVSFSTDVTVNYPLSAPLNVANGPGIVAAMHTAINSLVRSATTQTWEAIRQARFAMLNGLTAHGTASEPNRGRFILMLTDGAPCCPGAIPVTQYTLCESAQTDPRIQTQNGALLSEYVLYSQSLNQALITQQNRISLNIVGIGSPDPLIDHGPGFPRPWQQYVAGRNPAQNFRDGNLAKEILMFNLANDQGLMRNPPHLPSPLPPTVPREYFWDFPCVVESPGTPSERVIDGAERASHARGKYAFAQNATQLQEVFDTMIKNYRIRLVE